MSCQIWNFCMTAGADRSFNIVWESGGNPVDLTGSQVLMKIRKLSTGVNDLEIDSDAPGDSTISIPFPLTGSIDTLISNIDTMDFPRGQYCYEITRVVGSSTELILKGSISVEKGL